MFTLYGASIGISRFVLASLNVVAVQNVVGYDIYLYPHAANE
jgi:hypothetical protein